LNGPAGHPTGLAGNDAIPPTPYEQALRFLYGLRLFGAKLGLEHSLQLAERAGHPERQLRFIHVAGTNGKGSTCAMLESIYRAAGWRVGLFTSPHLISFRERLQVNREMISEAEVCRFTAEMQALCSTFAPDQHPTFFEVVTVMALRWFAEQRCDLVIWETGLGGRLDATNIVTPLACVITNIQYDHEKWLGHTLAEIAREKAGIIKPGVPVVTAARAPEALEVIEATAARQGAPLHRICAVDSAGDSRPAASLPLLGAHQQWNARVALKVVELLQQSIPVAAEAQRQGLSSVRWAGRMQVLRGVDGRMFILDGAHNPAGAEVLRDALAQHFPELRPVLVLGILADKNWRTMCELLAPCASLILTVAVASERTADAEELASVCRSVNPSAPVRSCGTLTEAFACCRDARAVVVAGSLYLIGEALELLAPPGSGFGSERLLNEWSGGLSPSANP